MSLIKVDLINRKYPVIIGSGKIANLGSLLKKLPPDSRIFIFYDAQFFTLHGQTVKENLRIPSGRFVEMTLPRGEKAKSLANVSKIYDFLLSEKISRTDFILACGGGVTTDLVGFIAATVLRGVAWGAIPTTLLGMVDAAIGGKTGVNHPLGKNLIGAFWQPEFVLCEPRFLATLPFRQLMCGLGEIVKYAGLIGPPMLTPLKKYYQKGDFYDERGVTHLIKLGVAYKALLVAEDERDNEVRMFLNFGHTFVHAIENATGYGRLLHGEAVLLGVAAALEMSLQINPIAEKHLKEYQLLVYDMLKLVPHLKLQSDKILKAMALDKKRILRENRFILLNQPGKPFITRNPNMRIIKTALNIMLSKYQAGGGQNV